MKRGKSGTLLSRSYTGTFLLLLFLACIASFMFIPLFYAGIQSFKPPEEILAFPPRFFAKNPTLDNFIEVFHGGNLWVPLPDIYSTAFLFPPEERRLIFWWRHWPHTSGEAPFPERHFVASGRLGVAFRPEVTGVAQYIIISKLHLINSNGSIILPALANTFGVFLMKQFMDFQCRTLRWRLPGLTEPTSIKSFSSLLCPPQSLPG